MSLDSDITKWSGDLSEIYSVMTKIAGEYFMENCQEIPYYLFLGENWFALCDSLFCGVKEKDGEEIYSFIFRGTYYKIDGHLSFQKILEEFIDDETELFATIPLSVKRAREIYEKAKNPKHFSGGYEFSYEALQIRVYEDYLPPPINLDVLKEKQIYLN